MNLKKFLECGIFIDNKEIKLDKNNAKLVYGETYDEYGLTIDSVKYYCILNLLHLLLEKEGYDVTSDIIIGDIASLRNKDTLIIREKIAENVKLIRKLKESLNLKPNFVLMSDLFEKDDFKRDLNLVNSKFKDMQIIELAKKTVISSKLNEEEKRNFLYAKEEVALILDYDIKIGPPREYYYDEIARKINGKLKSFIVKPTYPLGKSIDYFLLNPEIERFGLTPYKAGSNRLQDNRVLLKDISKSIPLIKKTFIPIDQSLPNPILDLQNTIDLINSCFGKKIVFRKEFCNNLDDELSKIGDIVGA